MYPSMRCEWCGWETKLERAYYGTVLCLSCRENPEIVRAIQKGRGFL